MIFEWVAEGEHWRVSGWLAGGALEGEWVVGWRVEWLVGWRER